jgi:uncharacterized protein YjiS (DUF1127 family)
MNFVLDPFSRLPANDQRLGRPAPWALFAAAGRALVAALDRAIAPVTVAYARARLFRELSALSDRSLADIGLTRSDIATVAYGAFDRKAQTVKTVSVANDQTAPIAA